MCKNDINWMTDRQTDRKLNVAGLQPTSGVGEKYDVCYETKNKNVGTNHIQHTHPIVDISIFCCFQEL
jgi:hypothetical protein